MWLAWRLDDDGQQVAGGVDEAGPVLDKGKVLQMGEALLEFLDYLLDDEGAIIRGRQKSGQGASSAQQEPVVYGQSEIGVDQLGVPALHLLAAREQDVKLLVAQRFGDAEECLGMKYFSCQRTEGTLQLVDRDDDMVCRDAAGMRVGRVVL